MALTVSECDYLRQVLVELAGEVQHDFLWCRHYGVDYSSLFGGA